jgi:subfamily B ATP-binding cassette protein MsbA
MKRIKEILGLLTDFKRAVALNMLFNLLSTLFSVISFASVIPFLKILFNTGEITISETKPVFSSSSEDMMDWLNYWINSYIIEFGKESALFYFSALIVVVFLLKNIMRYMATYYVAQIRVGVVASFREKMHAKLVRLPLSYFTEERKGNILTKVTGDVSEVEWTILGSIEMIFRDPIMFIVYFGFLIKMNWQLTLMVLIVLPISGLLISLAAKNLKSSAKRGQEQLDNILSTIEETVSGLRIIKSFNAEETTHGKFTESNEKFRNLMTKLYYRQYLGSPISEFLGAVAMAFILWFGGRMIVQESASFDGAFFITFILIFSQLIPPAKSVAEAYFRLKKGGASLDRINELLNTDEKIHEVANPITLSGFNDKVEFKNVHFEYEKGMPVLKNINLSVKKGSMVALVGQSGGGKSTIADLVPRFYDITSGDILIDGNPIKQVGLKDLRSLMGIVSQQSVLFNDTVFNNIALGMPNATEEEVTKAAKVANAHEFIEHLENGYHTNIGDGGGKLSGGQRQRLSIARAVLKNPPILILDEATSALDTESEKLVQDALTKLLENRTSLVIAHRLSTIQHADEIVVLKNGEIMEQGSHSELLAKNGEYKKLHDLQSFD